MRLLSLGLLLALSGTVAAQVHGVNTHVTQDKYTADQAQSMMAHVHLMSFRDAYYWSNAELTKGVLQPNAVLRELERQISLSQAAGNDSPLIVLCCGNGQYHATGFPLSGEARAGFLRYVHWVATRLKGKVTEWELWNEWNIGHHTHTNVRHGDPVEYVSLLREVHATLKAIDPGNVVVAGAIAGWDMAWAEAFLAAGGANYADAISIHPYAWPNLPEIHTDFVWRFRDLVNQYRDGMPIYISEIGWPDYRGAHGISQWRQSVYLSRHLLLLRQNTQVKRVYWYALANDGTDRTSPDHNFGLRRADLTSKLANCTMHATQHILAGTLTAARRFYRDTVGWFTHLTFNAPDGSYVHALWGETAGTSLSVSVPTGGTYQKRMCVQRPMSFSGGRVFVGSLAVIRTSSASIEVK
jgi:hypothetical protein